MAKVINFKCADSVFYATWKNEYDGERWITHCLILPHNGNKRYKGTALCNPTDTYNETTGKKLSFIRALQSLISEEKFSINIGDVIKEIVI